jgi:hypothetical protein
MTGQACAGNRAAPHERRVQHAGAAGAGPAADPDALEELGEQIATLTAHIAAATHELLVMIADFDRLRGWEAGGHRSCAHWLAFRTQVDLGTAREKVRAARALEALPATAAAMSRGELTFSQVRALTRIADTSNESELLELARGLTIEKLERVVRAWRRSSSRRDEVEREREQFASRSLSIFPDDEGMYLVRGRLMPEVAALLMRAIEAASDELFRERPAALEASLREAAQRRADALSLLAERALAAGLAVRANRDDAAGEARAVRVPISGTRAARYQVVIHVQAGVAPRPDISHETPGQFGPQIRSDGREPEDGSAPEDGGAPEHLAPPEHLGPPEQLGPPEHPGALEDGGELEDGTRLCRDTTRRLCCDAAVVRVVHDGGGRVLDAGRRTRTIPPALRRALEVRDRGCRFPGCGLRFTDAHHVRHWADAGETSLGNCLLLCSHHHRLVHEGGWRVQWWGGRIPVFIDPRGNAHSDARTRAAPRLPDDPAAALAEAQRARRLASHAPDAPDAAGATGVTRGVDETGAMRGWRLGARWRTESEIPHDVWRRASEAL